MPSPGFRRARPALALTLLAPTLAAAWDNPPTPPQTSAKTLEGVSVSARSEPKTQAGFPATKVTVAAAQIQETVNAVDVEDAAKYLPSVFIRKRNYGDTEPVLATRDWGVNSSARTLVYIDDVPVSALIANNNTIGAPRWGMASPDSIDHIDMLYGPFSAAYPGNSMGGVLRIDTKLPDQPEVTLKQTEAMQDFDLYGTHDHLWTSQTTFTAGEHSGNWGFFFSANAMNSFSQPLSFITSPGVPTGTSGTLPARNKTGQTANVLGAGGLLHSRTLDLNGRLSYDITPWLQASYMVGYWHDMGQAQAQTYLDNAAGAPTYGKAAAFASSIYGLGADHLMQAATLKTDTRGDFDGELVVTHYAFLRDSQWTPAGVATDTGLTTHGRLASYAGTNWSTADLRGTWRPDGYDGTQEVTAGAHADQYTLKNPTTNLTDWLDPQSTTTLYSAGNGKTSTRAVWAQDAWRFATDWLLTLGGRYEWWQASDGFNFSGKTAIHQPSEKSDAFSPKATLRWDLAPDWRITGSLARSVRFPTVGELYQLVSTGTTYTSPNPDLKPERAYDGELAVEHATDGGLVRLSLFQENTRNALIQQTAFLAQYPVPVNYVVNVGEVRNRGVELAMQRDDVLLRGLELSGSVTFVDSTILSDDSFASAAGTTADGKHVPYVPRWRATAVATYRPDQAWSFTLAGRYSGRQYSTLDNTDDTPHVFGAFDAFTVFDARIQYRINSNLTAGFGVDNLTNEKYFLYHSFPQRTFVADLKLRL